MQRRIEVPPAGKAAKICLHVPLFLHCARLYTFVFLFVKNILSPHSWHMRDCLFQDVEEEIFWAEKEPFRTEITSSKQRGRLFC